MYKKFPNSLYYLFAFLLLTACKKEVNPGHTSSGTPSDKAPKIAVIISTLNNPWFVVLGETAVNKAEELGYDAVMFDSENNTAKETDHFDNIIAAGYSAIIFNPTDADGSVSNVQKAKDAGIPVFCIDREINSKDAAVSQILSDNYAGCVEIGEYFVKKLNKKGTYIELLGLVGDNNTWNRSGGFHSVVDHFPDIKMVAQQSADFDRNKAMEVTESILQANPEIDAIFCGNDAMAVGAYQALISAGKDDRVMVFGFDGARDVINSIAEQKILATAMQFPKQMSVIAAEQADQYIKGHRDFQTKLPIAVELVTPENVQEFQAYGKK